MQRDDKNQSSTVTIYGACDLHTDLKTEKKAAKLRARQPSNRGKSERSKDNTTYSEYAMATLTMFVPAAPAIGTAASTVGTFIGETFYKAGAFIAAVSGDHEKALDFVAAMSTGVEPSEEKTAGNYQSSSKNNR